MPRGDSVRKGKKMATKSAGKLSFEDFVRVSTLTALEAIRVQPKGSGIKNPRIWVGIWVDPYGGGPGPIGGAGGFPGAGGLGQ